MQSGNLPGLVVELERLHPAPPRMRPSSRSVRLTRGVAEQKRGQAMLGATFIVLGSGALADEIAQCLVLGCGHPDRSEVAALIGASQLLGIAAIGFDLVARLLGDERRCNDLAVDAEVRELPVQGVARGTGFVADLQVLAAAELVDELAHCLGTVGELPEVPNLPAPLGDGRGDGFSVNIQAQISSTILHDRLLRCGSAFRVSHQP